MLLILYQVAYLLDYKLAETELENTLISGSAQLASQISGAFTSGFEFDGTISGSATSTGSFGYFNTGDVGVTDHIQATRIGLGGNIILGRQIFMVDIALCHTR